MAKTRTTPYAPWSNGETERMNKTWMLMLTCMVEENPKKWDLLLQKALMHDRSFNHASTRFTPYSLMFGREMRLPLDECMENPPEEVAAIHPNVLKNIGNIYVRLKVLPGKSSKLHKNVKRIAMIVAVSVNLFLLETLFSLKQSRYQREQVENSSSGGQDHRELWKSFQI